MSNNGLDYKLIAEQCGLNSNNDIDFVISNIDNLKNEYSQSNLILIYNYMLSKAQEPDVIMHLIRCVDMYRDSSSLEPLVDILLFRNGDSLDLNQKEKYNNVRAMCAKAIANQ